MYAFLKSKIILLAVSVTLAASSAVSAQAQDGTPKSRYPYYATWRVPDQTVSLMSKEGPGIFGGQWRTKNATLVEIPALKDHLPEYTKTYDLDMRAGAIGFDDSSWQKIEGPETSVKRGGGHVSFQLYRIKLTIPETIGTYKPAGTIAILTIMVDDYAEVWVNGQVERRNGGHSPATIQGYDVPNRVVLSQDVKAGDTFDIAVFGVNGPISRSPENFIFLREARVDFVAQDPLELCCE